MWLLLITLAAAAEPTETRLPPVSTLRVPTPPPGTSLQLAVKLHDSARGRATPDGGLVAQGDTTELAALAASEGLTFRQAVPDAPWVEDLRARALARTGEPAVDLAGLLWVDGPTEREALRAIGQQLQGLPLVENVWVEVHGVEPPGARDLAPPTDSYSALQTWQDPFPGLGHRLAHDLGFTGAGLRLSDVEYAFRADHEDLPFVRVEPDQTPTDPWGPDHGTATIGQVSAPANDYGMTGAAPGAEVAFYTEYSDEEGPRRSEAVTRACAESVPGDVVMLEMQAFGAVSYAPAEYDLSVWLATEVCTAAGITVVAAAGNGSDDLDGGPYVFYAARGDSGAIIVGAGTAGSDGTTNAEAYSTYGSRVDVQSWGSNVVTTAYGDLALPGGDIRQAYTAAFAGTSSATPMVAATALLLQQVAFERSGAPLDPRALRALLTTTGVPQHPDSAGLTPIGPQPDIGAALAAVETDADGDGAVAWLEDCDDLDPTRSPSRPEIVGNRIDDDCDGIVDEGAMPLGSALAGSAGEPELSITQVGDRLQLELSSALADASVLLVAGLTRADRPMFGGTVVPTPSVIRPLGTTDGAGQLLTAIRLPPSSAPGDTLYMQLWVEDPAAIEGLAATEGWRIVVDE